MAQVPAAEPTPAAPRPPRPPRLLLLGAAGVAVAVAAGVVSLDRLVAAAYGRLRPQLEQELGAALGHPLELGPYRGMGLWGLELGPTRVLPVPTDPSNLSIARVGVSLDPLSSLRRRLPVLQVSLGGVDVELVRNDAGGYWRLGEADPDAEPPRLDVRLRLAEPARLQLPDHGAELAVLARVGLQPHRQELSGDLQLGMAADGPLPLQLRGGGNWGEGRWQGQLASRRLDLAALGQGLGLPGAAAGQVDGLLRLRWDRDQPHCQGGLQVRRLRWQGEPAQPALQVPALDLRCEADTVAVPASRWRWGERDGGVALQAAWRDNGVELQALELSTGRSWLRGRGRLDQQLAISGDWQLQPADLPLDDPAVLALLGGPVRGALSLSGSWDQPRFTSRFAQASNPLLERWQARVQWRDDRLVLEQFSSPQLHSRGSLPLAFGGADGVAVGDLALEARLEAFPLERLSPVLGTQLAGRFDATGTVRGPLSGLTPSFQLQLAEPVVGPLRLAETWRGTWAGDPAGGGRLAMAPTVGDGALSARLDRRWVPVALQLERQGGRLSLDGTPRAYRWQAEAFPLGGLQLALGPAGTFQPLQGGLSGAGQLGLQPLAFRGAVDLKQASALGLTVRRVQLEGSYADRRYSATGSIEPRSSGVLDLDWSGRWQGGYRASLQGRDLDAVLVRELLEVWPRWSGELAVDPGAAADLGTLLIDTLGRAIDDQLAALNRARARLELARDAQEQLPALEKLERLAARFALDAELRGPRLLDTHLDLALSGHVWLPGQDRDTALAAEPIQVTVQGPVRLGAGSLAIEGLPLALLALLTPVPAELRGTLAARGRYGLAEQPELKLDLALVDASFDGTALSLDRGDVHLEGDALVVDVALHADGAERGIDLAGRVPLDPAADGLELRLSSRGDGLIFLSRLARPNLTWSEGTANLQLLVRGSLLQPIANGFLRLQDGRLAVLDQAVDQLQATVLFDFERLFLQEFTARVGETGQISGSGSLGLIEPQRTAEGEPAALSLSLENLPLRFPRINAITNGDLALGGSLAGLQVGGALEVSRGSINVQPARLAGEEGNGNGADAVVALAEERWDFQQPLVLFGPDVETATSEQLRQLIPNLALVQFNDLLVRLGPDLGVGIPGLADFRTAGSLRINGPLDPTIQARGVVQLQRGRVNLFTTSFSLDPTAPNVAVFTPALGLIPYVDVTLRTRVSDSLAATLPAAGPGDLGGQGSPNLAALEAAGGTGFGQLNLVQVFLTVAGPADRLADSIVLRSTPSLPESRLLALIGGNSLAGVVGGGAATALAAVVGQSLLSPILGTLGDAFGQRLNFAVYPAYVNQTVSRASEQRSQRVPPQLVMATEVGLDITNRLSATVLAAPNVDNAPPQLNLNLRASDLITVQASVDTEGSLQSQLQVFFRF